MEKTYGTYLDYLVLECLKEQTVALSIRQIAEKIHQYPDRRQRTNFYYRVRRSIQALEHLGYLQSETINCGKNNLLITKYQIKDYARKVQ